MGAGRYDVVVRQPGEAAERAEARRWTAAEIEHALPWLKRANAQGREVLIRPAPGEDARLVLMGGLNAAEVERMRRAGREPAVVVESAPGRLEGWVRVPACDEARRWEVLRQLAAERGADPAREEVGRYGRLAGFTNPRERAGEREPWVLCRASAGREASAGAELVAAAGQRLEARAQEAAAARERQAREPGRQRGSDRSRDGGMEL